MKPICFEIGKIYLSFIAEEELYVSKRDKNKITFVRESGAEYTVTTKVVAGVEVAVIIYGMLAVSAKYIK